MSKFWAIAVAMGCPIENKALVVLSMQVDDEKETAVAQAVSEVYLQTGTKLPLMGVNVRELTREYLAQALNALDEAEAKGPRVVQLVPKTPDPNVALQTLQMGIDGPYFPPGVENEPA